AGAGLLGVGWCLSRSKAEQRAAQRRLSEEVRCSARRLPQAEQRGLEQVRGGTQRAEEREAQALAGDGAVEHRCRKADRLVRGPIPRRVGVLGYRGIAVAHELQSSQKLCKIAPHSGISVVD